MREKRERERKREKENGSTKGDGGLDPQADGHDT